MGVGASANAFGIFADDLDTFKLQVLLHSRFEHIEQQAT